MQADAPPRLTPPYTAVIFTSLLAREAAELYARTSERMVKLVASQPGYLGMESVRGEDGRGITVSYWASADHARQWKQVAEHLAAQAAGRDVFYTWYRVRIATVEAEYGKPSEP